MEEDILNYSQTVFRGTQCIFLNKLDFTKKLQYTTLSCSIVKLYIVQGYPHRMRLQSRFYEIFLHLGFLVGQNWLISVLNYLVNHHNTQLNTETKNQALNRHIFKFSGSSLQYHPL